MLILELKEKAKKLPTPSRLWFKLAAHTLGAIKHLVDNATHKLNISTLRMMIKGGA